LNQDRTKSPPARALPRRDAIGDCDATASELLFAGAAAQEPPELTIAIPTFRRQDLLVEAVASALAQAGSIEIVVVDNDPASAVLGHLLAALPALRSAAFRYFRNAANLGLAGNLNRCIRLARGEWLTLLHDDDLLHPGFAARMMPHLRGGGIDGLLCRKLIQDDRALVYAEPGAKRLTRRLLHHVRFGFRPMRRIRPRHLFWEAPGNTVGFICRTRHAREIGGFYPEEDPSSDYFFYARFVEQFALFELAEALASYRIVGNSLLRPEVQLACLRRGYELQRFYAGSAVPRFWRRFTPLILARHVAAIAAISRSGLPRERLEAELGIRIPRDRPLLLYALRAALRGF
jgi:glycosyltransferase involved in cell wall biosynthesis